jgi:hypothetical protein
LSKIDVKPGKLPRSGFVQQGDIKQGDLIKIVCERDGVLKEFDVKIPLIPIPVTPSIDEPAPTEQKIKLL